MKHLLILQYVTHPKTITLRKMSGHHTVL